MKKKAWRVGAILVFSVVFVAVLTPGANGEMTLSLKANWTGGILPELEDINNDGASEIIDFVQALDIAIRDGSGIPLAGWPPENPAGSASSHPVAYDINGDGAKEIIFGNMGGVLYVYDANGTLSWSDDTCAAQFGGLISSSPILANINDDDFPEIIFVCDVCPSPFLIYAFDKNGNPVAPWTPLQAAGENVGPPAVSDINGDGNPDIVIAGGSIFTPPFFVQAFDSNGTDIWSTHPDGDFSIQSPVFGHPVIKDIDGDQEAEVIVASYDDISAVSKIYLLDSSTGSLKKSWGIACATNYPMEPSPPVVGIGADASILYYCNNTLYAWNGTGSSLWNYTAGPGSGRNSYPAVGDINSDALPEIIVPAGKNMVVLSSSGLLLARMNKTFEDYFMAALGIPHVDYSLFAPAIGDVDGDGRSEIVIGGDASSTAAIFVIAPDSYGPDLLLADPRNITYSSKTVPLNYSAHDISGVDSVWFSLDGRANTSASGNTTFDTGSYGTHVFAIYANDSFGNVNHSIVAFTSSCTENWSNCSGWSACSGGTQTRICTDTNSCGTNVSKPAETQSCTVPAPPSSGGGGGGVPTAYCGDGSVQKWRGEECEKNADCNASYVCKQCKCILSCVENWSCSSWSGCLPEGVQARTCTDRNNCSTSKNRPSVNQSCAYAGVTSSSGSVPLTPLVEIICGNQKCEEGETCDSCPEDCGICAVTTTASATGAEAAGAAGAGEGFETTGLVTGVTELSLFVVLAGLLFMMIIFLLALFFTSVKKNKKSNPPQTF